MDGKFCTFKNPNNPLITLFLVVVLGLSSPFALTEATSNWSLSDKVAIGAACEFIGLFASSFT